ncbi:hypothetical protein CYLTODRAFT_420866, partial [Cylindrobasidium torrendii FP15055 ss-10]
MVYQAEQVMGPGRKAYHRPCLACMTCKKRLDAYTLLEHNEQPYCKPCHSREHGTVDLRSQNLPTVARSPSVSPTSPVVPAKTGDTTADSPPRPVRMTTTGGSPIKFQVPATPRCAGCDKPVYFAEMVRALNRPYHRGCLRCKGPCQSTLNPARISDHDGEPMCTRCHRAQTGGGYAM